MRSACAECRATRGAGAEDMLRQSGCVSSAVCSTSDPHPDGAMGTVIHRTAWARRNIAANDSDSTRDLKGNNDLLSTHHRS